jgi:hypothetical protein
MVISIADNAWPSQNLKKPLDGFFGKRAQTMPTEATPMILWIVVREGRQLVCRPCALTGPVRIGIGGPLPLELLARTLPLPRNTEGTPWR